MPPRKRARLSEATSPNPASPASAVDTTSKATEEEDILNDPWTDEEEIGLFKGLIKWKPTGIHKHFRMLQLHDYLLENSYIHPRTEHTKLPRLWQKLASLYDLEALDQREDARQLSDVSDSENSDHGKEVEEDDDDDDDDVYSIAANRLHNELFELPEDDFGLEMWQQRFAKEKESREESPPTLPELNLASDAPIRFTPTIEIVPEDVSTPATKRRGRPSKPNNASQTAKSTAPTVKRRSRRGAGSVDAESEGQGSEEEENVQDGENEEDEKQEDDEEEEEEGEGEGEGESEDGGESSEAETSTTTRSKAARARGGRNAGRGRPRGRRR